MKFSICLVALVVQVSAALKTLDQSTLGVKTYEEPSSGCTLDSFACPDAQATLPTAPDTGDYVYPAKDSCKWGPIPFMHRRFEHHVTLTPNESPFPQQTP